MVHRTDEALEIIIFEERFCEQRMQAFCGNLSHQLLFVKVLIWLEMCVSTICTAVLSTIRDLPTVSTTLEAATALQKMLSVKITVIGLQWGILGNGPSHASLKHTQDLDRAHFGL
jgi:hypothetical protein